MSRRRTSLRFRGAAAAVALAAFLLLAEGYARFVDPVVPAWQLSDPGGVILVGHPSRLWAMGRGVRQNAGSTATINDLGLRGDLPRVPRPRGRERILLTGDSSFFGHGVPDDQTPAVLLETALRGRGIDAEVVNAAVPGYSTEQTRRLLDEVGWSLEPTLLLVCNLWSDENFDHFSDADLLRTQATFTQNPLSHLAFYRLLAGWLDRAAGGSGAHLVTWTRHAGFPETGVRRVDPKRYAENLDELARAARDHSAGVVFLQPTNRDLARGDESGIEALNPYFAAQEAVATWQGLPLVRTRAAFAEATLAGGPDALFLDDLHPTAAGDALVARAAADALVGAGWPLQRLLAEKPAFDASGVVDSTPSGAPSLAMSPQVNLFPSMPAAADTAPATPQGEWTVSGQVIAPPEPVEVTLRAEDDTKLGSTVVSGDAAFSLAVPPGHAAVHAEAAGASGRVWARVTREHPTVVLDLSAP